MAHRATKEIPALPEDITDKLGEDAYQWLLRYFQPTDFPRCLYSPEERKLYFLFENGAYQYRYFGDNKYHPKWVNYGITDNFIHIINNGYYSRNNSSGIHHSTQDNVGLILVEDIISGAKVGHIHPTLTLFGSNISIKRLATLKLLGYNEVIIWLDWDKKEYAIKAAQLAQSIGLRARVIHTKLDPKQYSYEEISEFFIPHQTTISL
jgi:hypothetical protein